MGYDVHITRKKFWADEHGLEITAEEWLQYVAGDPNFVLILKAKGTVSQSTFSQSVPIRGWSGLKVTFTARIPTTRSERRWLRLPPLWVQRYRETTERYIGAADSMTTTTRIETLCWSNKSGRSNGGQPLPFVRHEEIRTSSVPSKPGLSPLRLTGTVGCFGT
jgi:hypothetical protein